MNRQQTHAGNQRRNRLCHSCTFSKISQVFRNKNEAHASYNTNKNNAQPQRYAATRSKNTEISRIPKGFAKISSRKRQDITLCHTLGSCHRKFYTPTRPAKLTRNQDAINNV